MSNVETKPSEVVCAADDGAASSDAAPTIRVLTPREVPLGGPRAMSVRRPLPQRALSLIGAWCFLDHYGPDEVASTGGMDVPPHPHTGLATVSWLFSGEITHADSAGHRAVVRPGELSLMTAGSGISHSERSSGPSPELHGVQMWVALPEESRFGPRRFDHYTPPVRTGPGWSAQVFLGTGFGDTAPVPTATPMLAAEVRLEPGRTLDVDVAADFEHGVLVDTGEVTVDEQPVPADHLAYRRAGERRLQLAAGDRAVRLVLFGGPPLGEQIVMWWNFVGRSHEEIVAFRTAWQEQIGRPERRADSSEHLYGTAGETQTVAPPSFGLPEDDPGAPLPAPVLPNVRIRPREQPGGR
ncbi:pirin family protein [Ruania albidiflava]|uniref:pirin family protein n=1 Tax=Ruania albidiflava TaxID=366586 RepID=UPI0003B35396|nr:pirin family protein [Ruania albidiflava]